MAGRKKHEEHQNHEAWAIPYGDLITLLLAFFVVMYSMSSINEDKYRVLSDSLVAAFRGTPTTPTPVHFENSERGPDQQAGSVSVGRSRQAAASEANRIRALQAQKSQNPPGDPAALVQMASAVKEALQDLIDAGSVRVRESEMWLEIEINADILFPSGIAQTTKESAPILDRLATILAPFPNAIRVEGHTDTRPISTAVFPSNWELSAARAANVVQRFTRAGVDPLRMEVTGLGEYHPVASNETAEGRDRNRRVTVVVLQESAGELGDRLRLDPPPARDPGPARPELANPATH
jgi:chemotaxis protein MotB